MIHREQAASEGMNGLRKDNDANRTHLFVVDAHGGRDAVCAARHRPQPASTRVSREVVRGSCETTQRTRDTARTAEPVDHHVVQKLVLAETGLHLHRTEDGSEHSANKQKETRSLAADRTERWWLQWYSRLRCSRTRLGTSPQSTPRDPRGYHCEQEDRISITQCTQSST